MHVFFIEYFIKFKRLIVFAFLTKCMSKEVQYKLLFKPPWDIFQELICLQQLNIQRIFMKSAKTLGNVCAHHSIGQLDKKNRITWITVKNYKENINYNERQFQFFPWSFFLMINKYYDRLTWNIINTSLNAWINKLQKEFPNYFQKKNHQKFGKILTSTAEFIIFIK